MSIVADQKIKELEMRLAALERLVASLIAESIRQEERPVLTIGRKTG